jgi:hypothetical protein
MEILLKCRFGRRGILSPGDIRKYFSSIELLTGRPVKNIWRLSVASQKIRAEFGAGSPQWLQKSEEFSGVKIINTPA